MPLHLDLEDREAVLLVEVGHAFDQPGEAFGIRSGRGDRRIHCKRFDAAQPRRTASGFEDTTQDGYSKMSVIRQLSRFIRLSSDLRVTFCSPISMR